MNKKLLSLFTFLLILTSVSQSAFAQTSPQPQGRMMSPEAFCSLDAVKLQRGSNSNSVRKFQKILYRYHYTTAMSTSIDGLGVVFDLPEDGIFGKKTKDFTVMFQSANNLSKDGIVGAKTRAALTDWCMKNYNVGGTIRSDNPYVKKVSLGDEFTVKPNSSFIINDTSIVVSVSQIYGNKCSANAAVGLDVACTMEYAPAVKFSGMFGGDVSVGFSPQTLNVGEVSNFQLTEKTSATLKLVSVSDDGTSVKLKIEKK